MRYAVAALIVLAPLAAGCGGAPARQVEKPPATATVPPATKTVATTTAQQPMMLHLFFLARDGQLVAATRAIEHTEAPGGAALHELMDPPSEATTQVPDGLHLTIAEGRATVTGAT